jgi:hypothetical protein
MAFIHLTCVLRHHNCAERVRGGGIIIGHYPSMENLDLPDGYWLEINADTLVLHRPDNSIVATFSARGANPSEIEQVAKEDAEEG